jgi:hypothetical protein
MRTSFLAAVLVVLGRYLVDAAALVYSAEAADYVEPA